MTRRLLSLAENTDDELDSSGTAAEQFCVSLAAKQQSQHFHWNRPSTTTTTMTTFFERLVLLIYVYQLF